MNYERYKQTERKKSKGTLDGYKLQYEDLESSNWFKGKVNTLKQIIFKG